MATTIVFTDDEGLVTFASGKPTPMDRLASWIPLYQFIGPEGGNPVGLADGTTYPWAHREDFGCQFSIEHIPQDRLQDWDRLRRWLLGGGAPPQAVTGTVRLNTGDLADNFYDCRIWPGYIPDDAEPMDRNAIEYRITLRLLRIIPRRMICSYDVAQTADVS